jgi:hypothetical protein
MLIEALAPPPKLPKIFGNPSFEGEGDAFLRERIKEGLLLGESHQKNKKVQSQCVRVTLLGESVRINHSFGSSGLNIVCKGLLLGMRKGGRKENPMKLYLAYWTFINIMTVNTFILTHWTFVNIMTVNTFVVCFIGRDNLAQRRSSSSVGGPTSVHRSGGPRGIQRSPKVTSRQRSPRMKPPDSEHVSAYGWHGTKIITNFERP